MRSNLALLLAWVVAVAGGATDYKQALPGYRYEFPRDHFHHPGFRTEWWYYTGNVKAADGRRFGFELTFFRQAVSRDPNPSAWQIDDLYMAHLALSDLDEHRFYHDERINRAGPGIAGIDPSSSVIWNGNWQVRLTEAKHLLRAANAEFSVQLDLTPAKPPIIQGRDGISRKAAGPGQASHYISFTRLLASGNIAVRGTTLPVDGIAWMDHEFFSNSMDPTETGWDWLSLQFDDNTEVMLYRLRHQDGSVDPYSSGTYVDAQGHSTFLAAADFTMTSAGETWTSPQTKGVYPVHWRIAIPRFGLAAEISTPLPDQELPSSFGPSYWEGAIDAKGTRAGLTSRGVGYLEMTGYAGAMRE
jgi:predicted secreted hydrolase